MTEIPQQAPVSADRVAVRPRTPIPADTILIGKKPVMAYATAVMCTSVAELRNSLSRLEVELSAQLST